MNLDDINLSDEQDYCIQNICDFLKNNNNKLVYSVDGFAGTGKTTIISFLTKLISTERSLRYRYRNIAFLTFTGKASSVLKKKLEEFKLLTDDEYYVGTIHSLLYVPKLEYDPELKIKKIVGWKKRDNIIDMYDLIIIDESSMVNQEILNDLIDQNVPIIMFGDSFQLQPVSGKQNTFILDPDFKLKTIHRQALDNPIIYLSKYIRENYHIPHGIFSPSVFKLDWNQQKTQELFYNLDYSNFDNINELCVLVGYNNTRTSINKLIRQKIGFPKKMPICTGEKVMCLHNDGVLCNGQIGLVLFELYQPQYKLWKLDIKFDNDIIHQLYCPTKFFNKSNKYNIFEELKNIKKQYPKIKNINCLDYSYSITVHKSQGSEFDKVVLFEERLPNMDDYSYARWLYTAVTRSKEKLFIISR